MWASAGTESTREARKGRLFSASCHKPAVAVPIHSTRRPGCPVVSSVRTLSAGKPCSGPMVAHVPRSHLANPASVPAQRISVPSAASQTSAHQAMLEGNPCAFDSDHQAPWCR
jgi:hypothetical protein